MASNDQEESFVNISLVATPPKKKKKEECFIHVCTGDELELRKLITPYALEQIRKARYIIVV